MGNYKNESEIDVNIRSEMFSFKFEFHNGYEANIAEIAYKI